MSRAPRIDLVRRRIAGAVNLLRQVDPLVQLLHDLGYERQVAAEKIRSSGGERDWALDTHGDPAARAAYRALAKGVDSGCAQIVAASHNALRVLNDGPPPGSNRQHPATVDALALVDAINAQHRRIVRGEEMPLQPAQPLPKGVERQLAHRVHGLEAEVTRLRRLVVQLGGRP